jgi:hypothetical protein
VYQHVDRVVPGQRLAAQNAPDGLSLERERLPLRVQEEKGLVAPWKDA